MPLCNHRDWQRLIPLPPAPNKDGEWKRRYKFVGADICGNTAIVSWSKDGVTYHRCAMHMRGPKDGSSKDPRSIGGSERFRYSI